MGRLPAPRQTAPASRSRSPICQTDTQADFKFKSRRFWTGLGIWGVGFVLAFWLSWNTNTNWNRGVFAKLSYGPRGGGALWSYLLLWLMYVWGRHDPAAFAAKVATVMPVDVVS